MIASWSMLYIFCNCVLQGMSEDVEKLTRERDEMRQLLDKFERHMAEVNLIDNYVFIFYS